MKADRLDAALAALEEESLDALSLPTLARPVGVSQAVPSVDERIEVPADRPQG